MNIRYNLSQIAFLLLGFSSALLGLSMLLMGSHRHIEMTINFFSISNILSYELANLIAAIGFLILSVVAALASFRQKLEPVLAAVLIVIAIFPLLSLFSADMWMQDLGGFPVIGSGQGVIKYFALLSIALCILLPDLCQKKRQWLAIFPVLMVLAWIGGMKFFEFEAQGIKVLLETSPFMSWMYAVWDLQTASNLIGVFDLLAVALLVLSIYKPLFFWPGVLLAGSVMLMTQTFLFTLPGSLSADTIFTTTGHFLIKDLWFLANLLFFVKFRDS